MKKLFIISALISALFSANAMASDYSLVVNVRSYHWIREQVAYFGLNEENYGLGVEQKDGDNRIEYGYYRNSYYKYSAYTSYSRDVIKLGHASLGWMTGIATGYNISPIMPLAGLKVNYDYGKLGASLTLIPNMTLNGVKDTGFAALQFRYKL
jgi:hypothetical protein